MLALQQTNPEPSVTDPTLATAPRSGAAVTFRGLAPELKARLRIRAARNSRSVEAEVRAILEAALAVPTEDQADFGAFARLLFAPLGGVELELPPRDPARDPPDFGTGQGGAAEPLRPQVQATDASPAASVAQAPASRAAAASKQAGVKPRGSGP